MGIFPKKNASENISAMNCPICLRLTDTVRTSKIVIVMVTRIKFPVPTRVFSI